MYTFTQLSNEHIYSFRSFIACIAHQLHQITYAKQLRLPRSEQKRWCIFIFYLSKYNQAKNKNGPLLATKNDVAMS
jgi:hypothetical protein